MARAELAFSITAADRASGALDRVAKSLFGVDKAQSGLERVARGVRNVALAASAAITGVAGAVAVGVSRVLDEADELGKMAQSIGVPVAELSRLKHAADLSGLSLDQLGTAVGRLNRNVVEAAQGLQSPARAFDTLGLSIRNTDGTLRSVGELLPDIAAKFQAMPDGPEKTALAMQLLGRSGADMIPLLNAGAEGLAAMMREADELGIVIDAKTAAAAERFNDNLTRLGRVKDGIITQITARMLPAFEVLGQTLLDVAKSSGTMQSAADLLSGALKGLVSAGVIVGAVFGTLYEVIKGVAGAIFAIVEGEFGQAWEMLKSGANDGAATMTGAIDLINQVWTETGAEVAAAAPVIGQQLAAPAIVSARAVNDAAREMQRTMREGARVFEQTRTPLERLSIEQAELSELLKAGAIDQDTYTRAMARAEVQFGTLGSVAQASGQILESSVNRAIDDLIDGSFKAIDVVKELGKALLKLAVQKGFEILINIATGGTASLFGGGGIGGLLGGLFGGFFAGGGHIPAGKFGIVGEAGPELIQGPADVTPIGRSDGGDRVVIRLPAIRPEERYSGREVSRLFDALAQEAGLRGLRLAVERG